jgi:hypothetical protein
MSSISRSQQTSILLSNANQSTPDLTLHFYISRTLSLLVRTHKTNSNPTHTPPWLSRQQHSVRQTGQFNTSESTYTLNINPKPRGRLTSKRPLISPLKILLESAIKPRKKSMTAYTQVKSGCAFRADMLHASLSATLYRRARRDGRTRSQLGGI